MMMVTSPNDVSVVVAHYEGYAQLGASTQQAVLQEMRNQLARDIRQGVLEYLQPELADGTALYKIVVMPFAAFEQFKGTGETIRWAQHEALEQMYEVAREFGCPMGDDIAIWLGRELAALQAYRAASEVRRAQPPEG